MKTRVILVLWLLSAAATACKRHAPVPTNPASGPTWAYVQTAETYPCSGHTIQPECLNIISSRSGHRRFPGSLQAPAGVGEFSVETALGKTTIVNQYSPIARTTLRNCSKSIGLTMKELQPI
jgi:hypothetical protein